MVCWGSEKRNRVWNKEEEDEERKRVGKKGGHGDGDGWYGDGGRLNAKKENHFEGWGQREGEKGRVRNMQINTWPAIVLN